MVTESVRRRRSQELLNRRTRGILGKGLLYVAVVLMAIWSLLPFLYMVNISLMDTVDVVSAPPKWFPWPPKFGEWRMVVLGSKGAAGAGGSFGEIDEEGYKSTGGFEMQRSAQGIPGAIGRSFIVALGTTILNLIIGSFAGYGMARYPNFWFTDATLNFLMITRMLPGLALLIPFFILFL